MNQETILKIITDNPGISLVDLNLELIKASHPKELTNGEINVMLYNLTTTFQIRRVYVTGQDFAKTFYFPPNVAFHLS